MTQPLQAIIYTQRVATSVLFLGLLGLVSLGVYMLWSRAYPRPVLLFHSEGAWLKDAQQTLFEQVPELAAAGVQFEDLQFYLAHWDFLHAAEATDGWLQKRFVRKMQRDLAVKAASDRILTMLDDGTYKTRVVKAIDDLRDETRAAAGEPTNREDVGLHHRNLLLNVYAPSMWRMLDTRRVRGFALHFTLFQTLLQDVTDVVFKSRLPGIWKDAAPKQVAMATRITRTYWSYKKFMFGLPMMMIKGRDPQVPPTSGGQTGPVVPASVWRDMEQDDEDITEHFIFLFIPFLIPIALIALFFKDAIKLLQAFFQILAVLISAITDPIRFITILFSGLIAIVLLVTYMIVGVFLSILNVPIAIIVVVAINVALSLMWIASYVLLVAATAVLWVVDMCTGGMISSFMRCERPPDEWVRQAGFAEENRFVRAFVACARPCGNRYVPEGLFCKRRPWGSPHYCLHQLIAQAHAGLDPPMGAGINNHACQRALQPHRAYVYAICANNKGEKVKSWCDALFCDGSEPEKPPFCGPRPPPPPPPPPETSLDRLVTAAGVLGVCAATLFMIKAGITV